MMESSANPRFEAHECTASFKRDAESFKIDGLVIRNSYLFGLILHLDDFFSLLQPSRVTLKESPDFRSIDASNSGIVFIDTRRANEAQVRDWKNAQSLAETTFPTLRFFDLKLYLHAIQLPPKAKASALRRMNKKAKGTRESAASNATASDDAEAIGLALRLSREIKERGWIANPGAEPLVAELEATDFIQSS
jgi:hypothetical protein